ncbi:hypothetical protein A3A60_01600 [Candidatus Curtissbacteria bacterium RIFCSPLOWO2_01_FULL_42_26]|uniref:Uncharacterized protein n=1 Tax=Candidatus Curtissbacteria bacterium RIFCSPLOWO2_01_FULL_42_26 TaxID=1797729 RepID=A0A1F5I025_9BACT|nr:MAG: hypothetical protein A3A60_01600 [Candidatus Curtissbacteria bacterium RIFCSPLOWO2_01_FULL_42_26]
MGAVLERQRVNVKHLTVDLPVGRINFDYPIEFLLDGWQKYKDQSLGLLGDEKGYLKCAAELAVLTGLTGRRLKFGDGKELLENISFVRQKNRTDSSEFVRLAANFKLLFPEDMEKLKLDEQAWQVAAFACAQGGFTTYLENAFYTKILFPENFGEAGYDSKWGFFKQEIDDLVKNRQALSLYPWFAARVRIVFPEHWNEVKPSTSDLQRFSDYTKGLLFHGIVDSLFHINIMLAEEVIVDEEGLKLIKPEPIFGTGEAPILPQVRRF